jgi:hypothetical protein
LAYVEYKKQEALEFIRWRPEFFAELTVRRVFMFWCDVPANLSEDLSARDVLVGQWPAICFSALALLGWGLMLARRPRPAWFFAPGLLLYPCLYYITYPHPRYRHPIEPLMLILAVFAVSECKELKSRS